MRLIEKIAKKRKRRKRAQDIQYPGFKIRPMGKTDGTQRVQFIWSPEMKKKMGDVVVKMVEEGAGVKPGTAT